MYRPLCLLLCCAAVLPAPAHAGRAKSNQLLRVVSPTGRAPASAHPFVNVVLRFGTGSEGTADPASFRARLRGGNVTPPFERNTENGTVVGIGAALRAAVGGPGRAPA